MVALWKEHVIKSYQCVGRTEEERRLVLSFWGDGAKEEGDDYL